MKNVSPLKHKKQLSVKSSTAESLEKGPTLVELPTIEKWIATSPPTRFYGSKKRLLPWIYQNVRDLKFDTAFDPFGGTASVSRLLQGMGKSVTYGDAFLFNRQIASAVLGGTPTINQKNFISWVENVQPRRGWVSDYFDDIFYTAEENRWIDGLAYKLQRSSFDQKTKDVVCFCFYQAALRKRPFNLFHRANVSLRLKQDIKRSFGNLTTWNKSFVEHMVEAFSDLLACPRNSIEPSKIVPCSNPLQNDGSYDLVYLDPPYLNRKLSSPGDDYWKKYAFLEIFASHFSNYPKELSSCRVPSLRRPEAFEEWATGEQYIKNLESLLDRFSKSIVVMSYMSDSFPEITELTELFRSRWPKTSVNYTQYTHALKKRKKSEVLFIGVPE